MFTRRHLLATATALPALSLAATAERTPPRWIVVLLRGAVDGLSVCAPYEERAYRDERPGIAIAPPGSEHGLIDLGVEGPKFGLHPALAPLMPLWQAGQFGLLHASGLVGAGRRSHFEAQDELEAGGRGNLSEGWLTRLMGDAGQSDAQVVRALYSGPVRPKLLAGAEASAALEGGQRGAGAGPAPMGGALERLYAQDPRQAEVWRAAQRGRQQVSQAMQAGAEMSPSMAGGGSSGMAPDMAGGVRGDAPDRGAPAPGSFPDTARRLAQTLRADPRLQFAVLELGGWDTHARQGAGQGQLANRLAPLGQGLALLARELGPLWQDTVVTVLSEFGRTVRENGNAGTDHGHGNAAWLLGGGVRGGRVLGEWPTLDASSRYQGRDLAITTDVRALLSGVAAQHLRLNDAGLARLFPGYAGRSLNVLG